MNLFLSVSVTLYAAGIVSWFHIVRQKDRVQLVLLSFFNLSLPFCLGEKSFLHAVLLGT